MQVPGAVQGNNKSRPTRSEVTRGGSTNTNNNTNTDHNQNNTDTETNDNDNHNTNTNTGSHPVLVGYATSSSEDNDPVPTPGSLPSLVEMVTPEGAARGLRFEDLSREAQMAYLVNTFNSIQFLQMTFERANWEGSRGRPPTEG